MTDQHKTTRRVLLLASYCDDDPNCTESVPCRDCLGMCDIVDVRGAIVANHGAIDHARAYRAPAPLASQRQSDE